MSDENLPPGTSTNDLDEGVCGECGEYHEQCLACEANLGCNAEVDYCENCAGLFCSDCGDKLDEDGNCRECDKEDEDSNDE